MFLIAFVAFMALTLLAAAVRVDIFGTMLVAGFALVIAALTRDPIPVIAVWFIGSIIILVKRPNHERRS